MHDYKKLHENLMKYVDNITEDIEYLLGEGREAAYKQTFLLLTGVKSRLDSQSYI